MLVLFKVMIHRGVNEIPEAHIMKRWTRNARDYEYPNEVCTTAGEQLGQSLLFANALDVVKSTEKDPRAGEILTKYLNMAKKDIELLHGDNSRHMSASDGNTTGAAYQSETGTKAEYADHTDYDSDGKRVVTNAYGAAGSSAYMTYADVNSIKAPNIPKEVGCKREIRYKHMFERKRKSMKRYTASTNVFPNIHEEDAVSNVWNDHSSAAPRKVAKKKKRSSAKK